MKKLFYTYRVWQFSFCGVVGLLALITFGFEVPSLSPLPAIVWGGIALVYYIFGTFVLIAGRQRHLAGPLAAMLFTIVIATLLDLANTNVILARLGHLSGVVIAGPLFLRVSAWFLWMYTLRLFSQGHSHPFSARLQWFLRGEVWVFYLLLVVDIPLLLSYFDVLPLWVHDVSRAIDIPLTLIVTLGIALFLLYGATRAYLLFPIQQQFRLLVIGNMCTVVITIGSSFIDGHQNINDPLLIFRTLIWLSYPLIWIYCFIREEWFAFDAAMQNILHFLFVILFLGVGTGILVSNHVFEQNSPPSFLLPLTLLCGSLGLHLLLSFIRQQFQEREQAFLKQEVARYFLPPSSNEKTFIGIHLLEAAKALVQIRTCFFVIWQAQRLLPFDGKRGSEALREFLPLLEDLVRAQRRENAPFYYGRSPRYLVVPVHESGFLLVPDAEFPHASRTQIALLQQLVTQSVPLLELALHRERIQEVRQLGTLVQLPVSALFTHFEQMGEYLCLYKDEPDATHLTFYPGQIQRISPGRVPHHPEAHWQAGFLHVSNSSSFERWITESSPSGDENVTWYIWISLGPGQGCILYRRFPFLCDFQPYIEVLHDLLHSESSLQQHIHRVKQRLDHMQMQEHVRVELVQHVTALIGDLESHNGLEFGWKNRFSAAWQRWIFPSKSVSVDDERSLQKDRAHLQKMLQKQHMHILLLDTDKEEAELLSLLLLDWGFSCSHVTTFSEVIQWRKEATTGHLFIVVAHSCWSPALASWLSIHTVPTFLFGSEDTFSSPWPTLMSTPLITASQLLRWCINNLPLPEMEESY